MAQGGCVRCTHVTRYGNCSEPVAAGLVERFGLARHPEDGRSCPAFARQPTDLDERAVRLLAVGAIEPADVELVRERGHVWRSDEAARLLDWCEATARDAAPACEVAPPCADRAAVGREVATDTEKRASGPISHARSSAEVSP